MAWKNDHISIKHEWLYFLFMILYCGILLLLLELSRRFRFIQIPLYWVLPFILTPIYIYYISSTPESSPLYIFFSASKLMMMIIACWVIQILRHQTPKLKQHNNNTQLLWLVLAWILCIGTAVNIVQSCVLEIYQMFVVNKEFWFPGNAIFGFILVFCQALPRNITISKDYHCVQYRLGKIWVISYSIWNCIWLWNVYSCRDTHHVMYMCRSMATHIAAPFIIASTWTDWDEWIQYRGYGLCLYYWVQQMPYVKYYLPFWALSPDVECTAPLDESLWFTVVVNWLSFIIAVAMVVKTVLDEVRSWQDSTYKKYSDSSLLQVIMAKIWSPVPTPEEGKDQVNLQFIA
eukprot:264663_1